MLRNLSLLSTVLFVLGLYSSFTHATLVSTNISGTVTLDNGGANPFGLNNGDSISATAVYDDALVTGASTDEAFFISTLTDWSFTITLGSFSFTESDVTDPTFTTFFFNLGVLDGIKFYIEPIDFAGFGDQTIEDFDGGRSLFVEAFPSNIPVLLEAQWDFPNASTPTPVSTNPNPNTIPEPTTLALISLGLAGLGFKRKRIAV